MTYRSFILKSALATALILPLSANAQTTCQGGPKGNCPALSSEQMQDLSIDLDAAVKAAQNTAKGAVQSARLSLFGLPGEESRNAFTPPTVNPTYMVSLMNEGTRSLVTVDAKTGNAQVVGTATGVLAQPGSMMGMGDQWHHKGDKTGWGGKGGFGPAGDMSAMKIGALDAIASAKAAIPDARPIMVRGVKSGDDTAWMVAMKTTQAATNKGPDKSMTMVFVDPTDGKVLSTRSFEPSAFGPKGDGMRGDGPRDGNKP